MRSNLLGKKHFNLRNWEKEKKWQEFCKPWIMLQLKLGMLLKRYCYEVEKRMYCDFICLSCILKFCLVSDCFVHWCLDDFVNDFLSCLCACILVTSGIFQIVCWNFRSLEVFLKEVNIQLKIKIDLRCHLIQCFKSMF